MKSVFYAYDRNEILRLIEYLKKLTDVKMECDNYLGRYTLDCDKEYFDLILKLGKKVINKRDLKVSYLNKYGEIRDAKNISVLYLIFPYTRKVDTIHHNNLPIDLIKYKDSLSRTLKREINLIPCIGDNAFELAIEADDEEFDMLKELSKKHLELYKNSPFESVMELKPNGALVQEEKNKNDEVFLSYVNEGIFLKGLRYPGGNNLVPKVEDKNDLSTGFKYNRTSFGIRKLEIEDISDNDLRKVKEVCKGSFVAYEEKDYNYFYDADENKTYGGYDMPFTMIDNGVFTSKVLYPSIDLVKVETEVNVARSTVGHNFNGRSVRDGLFNDFTYKDGRKTYIYTDYYKLIDNKLYHLSEESDMYEVYDVPNNFSLSDGIGKLDYPVVHESLNELTEEEKKRLSGIINIYIDSKLELKLK